VADDVDAVKRHELEPRVDLALELLGQHLEHDLVHASGSRIALG
jgi:hypothetical protein